MSESKANSSRSFMFRLIATIMALFLSCASSCLPVLAIESSQRPPAAAEKPRKPIGSVSAQERAARHTAKKLQLSLPASPSDAELECCHIFPEPLTPMVVAEVSGENASLSRALTAFCARKNVDDLSALQLFLKDLPTSRWNASLELNMAILRQESGRTADALSLFKSAWDKSKNQTGKPQSLIAQRAISELLYIQGTLGRVEDLKKGLAEVGKRPMQGSAQQRLAAVREAIHVMEHDPGSSFRCGPYAVAALLRLSGKRPKDMSAIKKASSTSKGTSLFQLKTWAEQSGMKMQAAKRTAGAQIVVPAVMHRKLAHFGAITAFRQNRY